MAKHLMSFLGTGNYSKTVYCKDGNSYESRYILESLIHIACVDWDWEQDKISVFLTAEAKKKHWETSDVTAQVSSNTESENMEDMRCLKEILDGQSELRNVQGVDIVGGGNEQEIWQMFEQMTAAIDDGDELYIDITNSFRFIPLLMSSVSVFAGTVKNATIKAIYYGAFVPNVSPTPVFDISGFVDIIDWSHGTRLFVKNGNVDAISTLGLSVLEKDKDYGSEMELMIKNLMDMMNGLDNSQGVGSAGKEADKITVLDAYKNYEAYKEMFMAKYKEDVKMSPLRKVLAVIDEDVEIFYNAAQLDSNFLMGMCAVSWYIRKGKVQQGFTALDETMKTYVCQRYGMDEMDYGVRDVAVHKMCLFMNKYTKKVKKINEEDSDKKEFEDKCRRKTYEKWINEVWKEDELRKWKLEHPDTNDNKENESEETSAMKIKEEENILCFLHELSYRIETETLIRKYFSQDTYEAWKKEKYQGDKDRTIVDANKKILWDLYKNGTVEKIKDGLSWDFVYLKCQVGDQRNSMNHFGYTYKKLAKEPLLDLMNYFSEFVEIVERENGEGYKEVNGVVNVLSDNVLKELRILVEEAEAAVKTV